MDKYRNIKQHVIVINVYMKTKEKRHVQLDRGKVMSRIIIMKTTEHFK